MIDLKEKIGALIFNRAPTMGMTPTSIYERLDCICKEARNYFDSDIKFKFDVDVAQDCIRLQAKLGQQIASAVIWDYTLQRDNNYIAADRIIFEMFASLKREHVAASHRIVTIDDKPEKYLDELSEAQKFIDQCKS